MTDTVLLLKTEIETFNFALRPSLVIEFAQNKQKIRTGQSMYRKVFNVFI